MGGAEGVGCVRDSDMVSKGSRLDDADGNSVLLVRQRHGGVQLAWRVFVVGNILKSGVDGGTVIELKFFLSWTR